MGVFSSSTHRAVDGPIMITPGYMAAIMSHRPPAPILSLGESTNALAIAASAPPAGGPLNESITVRAAALPFVASIAIQLIMQCMTASELVILARCNTRFLREASRLDSVAWRTQTYVL